VVSTGPEVVARTPDDRNARALVAHPRGGPAVAPRSADGVCAGWTPQAPDRLYRAEGDEGDEQAVNGNSEHCQVQPQAGVTGCRRSISAGQTSRSTTTGAWSEAPLPLRSSRST
jgi:hypothetical protein